MRSTISKLTVAATAAGLAWLAHPSSALAQSNEVSPTGKGIAGGALLGAEAVMLTEAALDVKPPWAYAVGGLAGGIGGGVAGYFAEQGGSAKLPLYLLAGGMALAIPTTVAVLSATAYEPPADYTEDRGPTDEPVADPAQGGSISKAPTRERRQARRQPKESPRERMERQLQLTPPALLGLGEGYVALSVPAVEVRDVFSAQETRQYGLAQQTEVRVPVLNYSF
ncbi:MAG: hypothetical protein KC766_30585 [Myxococcales bacterium]|nr:hypothetical protein [Myxococcales bacterium]